MVDDRLDILRYIVSVDFRIPLMRLNEMNKHESIKRNERREAMLSETFNKILANDTRFNRYRAMTLREYQGQSWNSGNDLADGDVIIMDENGSVVLYIDIKVDNSTEYFGTINMHSIMNFKKDDAHVYMCMSNDARIIRCYKSSDVRNTLAANRELKMSKHRGKLAHGCSGKLTVLKPTKSGWTTKDDSTYNVYEDDFMGCVQLNKVPTITKRN